MAEAPSNSSQTQTADVDMESNTTVNVEADVMQRFLERTRNDTLFELRRLQHGDRPVTGQSHRQSLEAFMSKNLDVPSGPEEGKQNVPANRDSVEEHRPEAVVVEVQGLYEQHRVSSILQSVQFRRNLERIIRGSISNTTHNAPSPARPRQSAVPPPPPVSQLNLGTQARELSQTGEVTERSRSPSQESIVSLSSSSTSSSSSEHAPVASPDQAELPAPGIPEQPVAAGRGLTWQNVSEVQREQVVQEISELLHSQLVSSTLRGEFRGALELHMQNLLSRTAANGAEVENTIRSLPPSGIIRNDFSHLGLHPPVDDVDNISVTSFSATAVPYSQSNLHLSREILSLKAQLAEMKTMMRLSFDLQMDIQRSIRQEVAAALSQAIGGAQASVSVSEGLATSRSRPVSDAQCLICLDRATDCVLYQCGHMCTCFVCARNLQTRGANCPVCRAPIRDVIRAYRTNQD